MADPNLSSLLKWSVEHSSATTNDPSAPPPKSSLTPEALSALFGGPSDADLMVESMTAITSPEISLDNKLIAFDNFEQLIENLDNANNLSPLGLWTPLLACLGDESSEMRMMAAWCVGTAVQNNEKSQERLLAMGGVPALVKVAVDEGEESQTRRKAVYAVSSAVRNFQAAMDVLVEELKQKEEWGELGSVDAADMDAVDGVIGRLREEAKGKGKGKGET
ncbi:ARM repeat-containing protein [Glarea lozoyensis ATCC 20868]|uniref:ARM repeat-containing protein n=1 Tax=Glarea lozoyensis (strain ATCC 20868 / MF5171) TaxID=1116229 RepID=S3DU30_GLAL2|nr:ARM repeat-containing protein [Glarea lozoyensis ATCC 20868]EPE29908.1 ARM repeat-containing protein [Glarea lozoyensis ATCC 20868]